MCLPFIPSALKTNDLAYHVDISHYAQKSLLSLFHDGQSPTSASLRTLPSAIWNSACL